MSMSRTHSARRVVTGASALALALSGLVGIAAHAAETPEYGNIRTDATGSITVHKHETGSQGTTLGSASEKQEVSGDPVEGIVFTAHQIQGIDLATTEGWTTLNTLTVPENACGDAGNTPQLAGKTFEPARPFAATDGEGKSKLSGLPIGAYLVCESGRTPTDASKKILKPAAPFVVTVPFPDHGNDPQTNGWIYDVHVYPKNTVTVASVKTQTIGTLGMQNDDDFTFVIETKVPRLASDQSFKFFTVADPLAANFTDIKIDSVTVDGTDAQATHIEKNDPNAKDQNKMARVSFTQDGLRFLKTKPNTMVRVTIKAKLSTLPTAPLTNTGYAYIDTIPGANPPGQPKVPVTPPTTPGQPPQNPTDNPGTPSNKVASLWGQYKFRKVDAANQNTPLQGAEFKVYAVAEDNSHLPVCTDKTPVGDAIMINNSNIITSDEQGWVDLKGLLIQSVKAEGTAEPVLDKDHRCFVIEEVKAPVGYQLPGTEEARRYPIKVAKGTTPGTETAVQNTKVTVPELPLTGASGQVLMLIAGSAFVMMALGGALVNRRRTVRN